MRHLGSVHLTPGSWIQEDVGVVEGPFVPSGFVAPLALTTERFRLEPLGQQHNDSDYEAWSSSVEHIRMTPGWETTSWPDDRSLVDNLRDLQGHAADFENRAGFTYTVLDPATGDVIGCVYIYPDGSEQHDARVRSWVRASRPELDVQLCARSQTGSRTMAVRACGLRRARRRRLTPPPAVTDDLCVPAESLSRHYFRPASEGAPEDEQGCRNHVDVSRRVRRRRERRGRRSFRLVLLGRRRGPQRRAGHRA